MTIKKLNLNFKKNFYERLFLHKIILNTTSIGADRNGNEKIKLETY